MDYFVFVHDSSFWTNHSMNSMILAIGMVGVYSLISNLYQKGWIFELAILISSTVGKGLIFSQIIPLMAAEKRAKLVFT